MTRRAWCRSLGLDRLPKWPRLIACLLLLCVVAACGGQPSHRSSSRYNPSRYYPPPGPSGDPWGPYIHEASGRFGVPELWVRKVMRQESGGQEDVISWAGAMGLMQVMPDTYDDLRGRYNLGDDPFDPHNNILAGTAYLREMYDRFGAPGFLAAYNAGPNRLDRYLNGGTPLPEETVNYVASIAPLLGSGTPMSGPLSVYAGGSGGYAPQLAARSASSQCDPDAAYDPGGTCALVRQPAVQPAVYAAVTPAPGFATGGCDPDAAYDPTRPCTPVPGSPAPSTEAAASVPAPPYVPPGGCDPDAAFDPARPCSVSFAPVPSAPVSPRFVAPRQGVAVPFVSAPAVSAPVVSAPVMSAPVASVALGSRGVGLATVPSAPLKPGPTAAIPVAVAPLPQLVARQPPAYAQGARRPLQETLAQRVTVRSGLAPGDWGIQVGAFADLAAAQIAADNARMALPGLLRTAKIELPPTTPFGGKVAFRARLVGLSPDAAADACARLSGRGAPCMTLPPTKVAF